MIDISDVVTDPEFATTYHGKRFRFYLENGRQKVRKESDFTFKGVVVPFMNLARKRNEMLLETMAGSLTIYCKFKLYGMALDKITDDAVLDFIKYDDNYWQIEEIRPWDNYGFIAAVAKMYETQQLFQEVDDELH